MYKRCARRSLISVLTCAVVFVGALMVADIGAADCGAHWKIHDMGRPQPPVVDPGTVSTQKSPGRPPSDAIVLFDGKDLSQWRNEDGGAAEWKVAKGYMEVVDGAGPILTKRGFGDCQLHVEWATAVQASGIGQHKSNSGVFLMGLYEVQVLDCYGNKSYPDGMPGGIYGQYPPMANACRPQGEWQTYDIVFRRPRFGLAGQLISPARMTVFHNGVVVQDNTELMGPTSWMERPPYEQHADKLPIQLQDHGDPVRFRNIWLRELPEDGVAPPVFEGVSVASEILDSYVGRYKRPDDDFTIVIRKEEDGLTAQVRDKPIRKLIPLSEKTFAFDKVGAELVFKVSAEGVVEGLTFHLGGESRETEKVE